MYTFNSLISRLIAGLVALATVVPASAESIRVLVRDQNGRSVSKFIWDETAPLIKSDAYLWIRERSESYSQSFEYLSGAWEPYSYMTQMGKALRRFGERAPV